MGLRFIVLTQCAWQGKAISVDRFPFVIGRARVCQLRVSSRRVAERHCTLDNRSGKVVVSDLGTGRTFLNGWRVAGKQELRQGDRLRVGPVELGVRYDRSLHGAQAAAASASGAELISPDDHEEAAAMLLLGRVNSERRQGHAGTETVSDLAGSTAIGLRVPAGDSSPATSTPPKDTASVAGAALQKYFRRSPI